MYQKLNSNLKPLFIIPARGGSKGLPGKNIKNLSGKPLIQYSLDLARCFTDDARICVSTDNLEIRDVLLSLNYNLPFLRPSKLSGDDADMNEVLIHAMDFYENAGIIFNVIILLQPTSPLRSIKDLINAGNIYDDSLDMVVSVCESPVNPFYLMCIEKEDGFLHKLFDNHLARRQDAPVVYQLNGAIYVINPISLKKKRLTNFEKRKKIVMDKSRSIDIDTLEDWSYLEYLIDKKIVDVSKLLVE